MQIREDGSGSFPFATLRTVGWLLAILSLVLIALGIVDVAWTAVKYVACDAADFAGWPTDPCDHADLIYTWIAVAIWCGVFVLVAGIVGTRFSQWQYSNIRQHRDTFSILCGVCALLFLPAVIVITALEFWKAEGMSVYTYGTDDKLEVNDGVKFGIPLAILVIAGLAWFVALAGLVMGCWCAPLGDLAYGPNARSYVANPRTTYTAPRKYHTTGHMGGGNANTFVSQYRGQRLEVPMSMPLGGSGAQAVYMGSYLTNGGGGMQGGGGAMMQAPPAPTPFPALPASTPNCQYGMGTCRSAGYPSLPFYG